MVRIISSSTILRRVCILGLCFFLPQPNPSMAADAPGENIALGKAVTFSTPPDYQHCTDAEDSLQLTDGQLTEGYFWTQKGCVGWRGASCVAVTVDLGRVEPISGVSLRTAAGAGGVEWPAAILIATSDDGAAYRKVADMVAADLETQGPWPEGYAVRQLVAGNLATRGRYVQFLMFPPRRGHVFCDEIEVFRGPESLLAADPGGEPLGDVAQYVLERKGLNALARRFSADAAGVQQAIETAADVDVAVKKDLAGRVEQIAQRLAPASIKVDRAFRAVLPFNEPHAELFVVQAALWKAMGRAGLTVWTPAVWDPVDLHRVPPKDSSGEIDVHAMRGEYRAAAVNLANSTDRPKQVRLRIEGLPGGPTPGYLAAAEVPWTDTTRGTPVAAALPEVKPQDGAWTVTVLPGMTRQAWFTFHPTDTAPGNHEGTMVIESEGEPAVRIPLALNVWPIDFPKQTTLLVGGWSYANGAGAYGMTAENREAFLEHLQSRFVNAPWARSGVMRKFEVLADGGVKLDTGEFDNWIAEWPNAKRYMVFVALSNNNRAATAFHGAKLGTPEFDKLVGAWITAWVEHLRGKGITPDRLGLLIHDEPHGDVDVESLVALARAIHAAEPEVIIWNDPIYEDPAKAPAALFETSTVLCPNRPMWLRSAAAFGQFYLDQQRHGRTLQLYSCSGPARLLDPYSYYRLQAWHAWQIGATGSFFWAFGDTGGSPSWNEYLSKHGPYTPLFIDDADVTPGKQMEAIRESVEDYETLVMLRAAVERAKAAGRNDAAVARAEDLLKTAADEVLDAKDADKLRWHDPKDRTPADAERVKVLEAIAALQ